MSRLRPRRSMGSVTVPLRGFAQALDTARRKTASAPAASTSVREVFDPMEPPWLELPDRRQLRPVARAGGRGAAESVQNCPWAPQLPLDIMSPRLPRDAGAALEICGVESRGRARSAAVARAPPALL